MRRKYVLFLFILFLTQDVFSYNVELNSDEPPSAAVVGRYTLYEDRYWFVNTLTVEQFEGEGYDVADEYQPDMILRVNYSRSNYQFTTTITSLSYPHITLEYLEGDHDLNVTVYENNHGSEGERIASYASMQQGNVRTEESQDPHYGVLINPSIFEIGNTFSVSKKLEFKVVRAEFLETSKGTNVTYVLESFFDNSVQMSNWTIWCDAKSGIIHKKIIIHKNPVRSSREEMRLIETGVIFEDTAVEESPRTRDIPGFPIHAIFVGMLLSLIILKKIQS